MTDLAKLVVKLEAESSKLHKELDRSTRSIRKFERTSKASFTRFDASLAAAGAGVTKLAGILAAGFGARFIRGQIAMADQLAKTSDKIGISIEQLQLWRYAAADTAGISAGAVDTALQRFSRRIGEAANGTGVLLKQLQANNIQLRDSSGQIRPLTDLLKDYGAAVASAGTKQEKLALTVAAFDTEGAGLVAVLEDIAAALGAAEEKATLLTEANARAAERFEAHWQEALEAVTGYFTNGVLGWYRILEGFFVDVNGDAARVSAQLIEAIDARTAAFRYVENIKSQFDGEQVTNPDGTIDKSAEAVELWTQALEDAENQLSDTRDAVRALEEQIADLNGSGGKPDISIVGDGLGPLDEFGGPGGETRSGTVVYGSWPGSGAAPAPSRSTFAESAPSFGGGGIPLEEYFAGSSGKTEAALADVESAMEDIESAGIGAAEGIAGAFGSAASRAITNWQGVGELLDGIASQIASSVVSAGINAALGAATGSGGADGGFSLSALFGRATGGPVSQGTPVWVGEQGRRELFVPDSNGHIYDPAVGGGGVTINNMGPPMTATRDGGGITLRQAVSAVNDDMVRQLSSGEGPMVDAFLGTSNLRMIPR